MSNDQGDWTNLQGAWRAGPEDRETRDRFRDMAAREKKRLQYEIGGEAALSLVSAAIFGWWATDAEGWARIALFAMSGFAMATPIVTSLVRRSVWRAQADTVESYRHFLRRRARLGLVLARLGYIGGPLGVAMGVLLAEPLGVRETGVSGLTLIAVASLALIGMCWWSLREARKWRRTLETLDTLKDEGVDADS